MEKVKLAELNNLYMSLVEAEQLCLDESIRKVFNQNLKDCLKELFLDNLDFLEEQPYGYILMNYKGVEMEIRTVGGIVLSVKDNEKAELIEDFKPVFNDIVGMNPICSYNFCYTINGERVAHPTIEWNTEPNTRLESLVMQVGNPMCQTIKEFEDYYLCSIIKQLGSELFTKDGFEKVFNTSHSNRILDRHRLQQIQKVYPDINTDAVNAWYSSYKNDANIQMGVYRR